MRSKPTIRLLVIGLLVCASFGARAQGVAWDELSRDQRELLADQEAGWTDLDPERQQRIALGARRYIEMNRRERVAAEDRFALWRGLTDRQRSTIRERYSDFRELNTVQREQLRRTYQNFNRLTPDQRNRLRQQFRDLSLDQRQRALREQLQDRRRTAPLNRR
jgi:hypothetical protein